MFTVTIEEKDEINECKGIYFYIATTPGVIFEYRYMDENGSYIKNNTMILETH